MAAPNSSNVSAMKPLSTGGVLVAPYGTTLPAEETPSGSVTIDSGFTALGYMDQDANVSVSEEVSSNDQNAWGGDLVLTVTSTRTESFSFKAIEQNVTAWKLRYGKDNVSGTDANAYIKHDGASFEEYVSVIIAEKLGDGRVHITVFPKGVLSSADAIDHSDSSGYGYGMTFKALAYSGSKTSYELYYTPTSVTTTTTTTTTA